MNWEERIRKASLEELKTGFIQDKAHYICLLCGEKVEKGIIYPLEGILYEAEKYMQIHIKQEHQSVFDYFINLDKKITGLSDHQKSLMKLFYEGRTDAEIQNELGIGSSSTIRNHRFILKEKERQAKILLLLMALLKEADHRSSNNAPSVIHEDDKYEKVFKKYFPQGTDGPLKTVIIKEKVKPLVLKEITKRFEAGRFYSEKEVNQLLQNVNDDFSTLRRYLIDYGFLKRKTDGSQYWVNDGMEEKDMDRKRELKQIYKDMKTECGIYQIRNTQNGKILVICTPNFKTINGKRMELQMGSYRNDELQADWNKYGEDAFAFEILEMLEEKEGEPINQKEELKKLEQKWLEKLQPFGEKGYNKPTKV